MAEASQLIEQVSNKYTLDDFTERGYQNFKSKVLNEGMVKNLEDGFMYWGAFEEEVMVGLIAIKLPAHLYNLFVHTDYQKKGIATRLWQHMLSHLNPESLTLFSSSHAIGLYQKLGFEKSGEKIDNDEIICYPMLWKMSKDSRNK